jgi:hypothetical protein
VVVSQYLLLSLMADAKYQIDRMETLHDYREQRQAGAKKKEKNSPSSGSKEEEEKEQQKEEKQSPR